MVGNLGVVLPISEGSVAHLWRRRSGTRHGKMKGHVCLGGAAAKVPRCLLWLPPSVDGGGGLARTSFITPDDTYCYLRMLFRLRNTGATFALLVQIVFQNQVGRNLEAEVDDIVVKSRAEGDLLADLRETFDDLLTTGLRLNPEKCTFEVRSGKLLGYLVSQRGIKVNPEKIRAIHEMQPSAIVWEAERLTGCLAALCHVISRSVEQSLPFLKALRGLDPFRWTEEQ